ncbi:MAG: hypothetical protein ABI134_30765, partial [Byssovorax sp.]
QASELDAELPGERRIAFKNQDFCHVGEGGPDALERKADNDIGPVKAVSNTRAPFTAPASSIVPKTTSVGPKPRGMLRG